MTRVLNVLEQSDANTYSRLSGQVGAASSGLMALSSGRCSFLADDREPFSSVQARRFAAMILEAADELDRLGTWILGL